MKRHLKYLSYVLRHKWFVFLAGLKVGVPVWRLIIHDLSKFTPTEWGPYARQFYDSKGRPRDIRRADGGYNPAAQPPEFQIAWLSHQKNWHHWQAWIMIGESGTITVLPIPEVFCREMAADWMGAGRAITGTWDCRDWYQANKHKMILDDDSRRRIEQIIMESTKNK